MADGSPDAAIETDLLAICGGDTIGPYHALLDVGHQQEIVGLVGTSTGYASRQPSGHWVMWAMSGARLASGESCDAPICKLFDSKGPLFAIGTPGGVEIRSSADGHVMAMLPPAASAGISDVGQYVWTATSTALTAWSPDGTQIVSHAGDYSSATIFAAPTEMRAVGGPLGTSAVERIPLSGVGPTSFSFPGSFVAWFFDGDNLLTATGSTVWVYSSDGTQQELVNLPNENAMGGTSGYFWTLKTDGTLSVYQLGGGTTPVASQMVRSDGQFLPFRNALFIMPPMGFTAITVVTMNASGVSFGSIETGRSTLRAFAMRSATDWMAGTSDGVVFVPDGSQTRAFDCGRVVDVAGSESGRSVITFASGVTYAIDVTTMSRTVVTQLALATAHLEIKQDGSLLMALANGGLTAVDLPSGTPRFTWTYPNGVDFSLAKAADRVADITGDMNVVHRRLLDFAQAPSYSDDPSVPNPYFGLVRPYQISPDGTKILASTVQGPPAQTQILSSTGTLLGAVGGYGAGWIDNDRFVAIGYGPRPGNVSSTRIYDSTGVPLITFQFFVDLERFSFVPPNTLVGLDGHIIDVTTGNLIRTIDHYFDSPPPGPAVAAGSFVIYPFDHYVFAEPL